MTNNPTIDGVSREDLRTLINDRNPAANHQILMARDKIRRLLDAPAVDRQEPIVWTYCPECGCEEVRHEEGAHKQCAECHQEWFSDVNYTDVVRKHLGGKFTDLQSTIAQLEDKLNKAIDLDFQRRETIEHLQARVQELESWRGEPIGYVDQPYAKWLQNKTSGWTTIWATEGSDNPARGKPSVALFTAPPAPVAVVLPELESSFEKWWEEDGQYCRAGGGSYEKTFAYRAYEACLDATAALNGERK